MISKWAKVRKPKTRKVAKGSEREESGPAARQKSPMVRFASDVLFRVGDV